jgi:hypothetical protein
MLAKLSNLGYGGIASPTAINNAPFILNSKNASI